jgi:hypothetical protein
MGRDDLFWTETSTSGLATRVEQPAAAETKAAQVNSRSAARRGRIKFMGEAGAKAVNLRG